MRVAKITKARRGALLAGRSRFEAVMAELEASPGNALYTHAIKTRAGKLWVGYNDEYGTVFACFTDPDAAKRLLPVGPYNRLNRHSGKWNFHGENPIAVVEAFATEVRAVL